MKKRMTWLCMALFCVASTMAAPPTGCDKSKSAKVNPVCHSETQTVAAKETPKKVKVTVVRGTPAKANQSSFASASGLVAFRDAETGKLRTPTAAEVAALQANNQNRVSEPIIMIDHGDHRGVESRIPESLYNYSVKVIDKDGRAHHSCAENLTHADQALEATKKRVAAEALDVQ